MLPLVGSTTVTSREFSGKERLAIGIYQKNRPALAGHFHPGPLEPHLVRLSQAHCLTEIDLNQTPPSPARLDLGPGESQGALPENSLDVLQIPRGGLQNRSNDTPLPYPTLRSRMTSC